MFNNLDGTYLDPDGRPRRPVTGVTVLERSVDLPTVRMIVVREAVARAAGAPRPDLRMHLIARHTSPAAAWKTPDELDADHVHAHAGPGAVDGHGADDLGWSRGDVLAILDEALEAL